MRLEIERGTKRFGETTVFEDFSATFEWGCVTTLVGPSGSGKSTLLSILAGYQPLDVGRISFVDENGSRSHPDPNLISWVPQGANALSRRTALDNVMLAPLAAGLGLSTARIRATEALEAVSMTHRMGERAGLLSGGELQRLAIARALASGRPVIFADEPTANLDIENTRRVAQAITRPLQGQMVIIATHDPYLVSLAQRVVKMRPSESLANG